jgi:hypothetical protein
MPLKIDYEEFYYNHNKDNVVYVPMIFDKYQNQIYYLYKNGDKIEIKLMFSFTRAPDN